MKKSRDTIILGFIIFYKSSRGSSSVSKSLCESLGSVLQDVNEVWLYVGQGLLCD